MTSLRCCLRSAWSRFARDQAGATAAEYAIMASLIAVVVVSAVMALGSATRDTLCSPSTEWASVDASVEVSEDCE